jgi:hypothetical protein
MESVMKDAEDEAFDELAKRQGHWGGGYQAKRQMAKARIEDDDDIQDYKRPWVGLTEEDFSAINQSCLTKLQAATSAESILKKKNT